MVMLTSWCPKQRRTALNVRLMFMLCFVWLVADSLIRRQIPMHSVKKVVSVSWLLFWLLLRVAVISYFVPTTPEIRGRVPLAPYKILGSL